MDWQEISARVVNGHGVASGRNGDPKFPGGTIAMQTRHFFARGVDLSPYFRGTINVSIAPHHYRVVAPKLTLENVRWHPTEPAEDFSFFDVRVLSPAGMWVAGLIYYPHPETKPAHFQNADVLELLLPWIEDVNASTALALKIPKQQIEIA